MFLSFVFYLPDLVLAEGDEFTKKEIEPEKKLEDGLDARYNEHFQQRMEALKRSVGTIEH